MMIMGNTVFNQHNNNINENNIIENDNKIIQNSEFEIELENRLEQCLSSVYGVGKIKVMITVENGNEIVVEKDLSSEVSDNIESDNNGIKKQNNNSKTDYKTVIIDGKPLILKEVKPKIKGVIIVAEGGDNLEVKNSIINAVQAVLNIEIHKIQVLKMK